jgi:hypothetical protein
MSPAAQRAVGEAPEVRETVARVVGPFALADLGTRCPGASLPAIRRELVAVRNEGLVLLDGRGRGARWRRVS